MKITRISGKATSVSEFHNHWIICFVLFLIEGVVCSKKKKKKKSENLEIWSAVNLHLSHREVQSMQLLLCSLSPESSNSVVYLVTISGEWIWHTTRLPTTKRRDKKLADFRGELGSTTQTYSCLRFYEYFSFTSALHRYSYFSPWGEFAYGTPFIFLAVMLGGFLTPLLIYKTPPLLSFMDFGISAVWVPVLVSYFGSPCGETYLLS